MRRIFPAFPWFVRLLLILVASPTGMAQVTGARLLTTFSSPVPTATRFFGLPADAVGTDRVIIGGAADTNAAYFHLFDLQGNLVTTYAITNPAPGPGQVFESFAAAGLGADRVLFGVTTGDNSSPRTTTGNVYLFSTNGTLLATFPNPTHDDGDSFGYKVAAVGSEHILIGAPTANTGANASGAAYLFDTNGVLVATFHDPAPSNFGSFGWAVASLGGNRIIIGAPSDAQYLGAAYVFNTNGGLLATIGCPPTETAGDFAYSVAGVGNDKVIVGSPFNSAGATLAGAAYLFNTNGSLLQTWTNPAPAPFDGFGISVAGIGANRVVIGESQANAGYSVGSVYIFSTNGAMVNVITNPVPNSGTAFGWPAVAVGSDQVLVGANFQSNGHAYLFALPYPQLNIARTGASVSLTWKTPETGMGLQQADRPDASNWSSTPEPVVAIGATNIVHQPLVTTNRFFRLRRR